MEFSPEHVMNMTYLRDFYIGMTDITVVRFEEGGDLHLSRFMIEFFLMFVIPYSYMFVHTFCELQMSIAGPRISVFTTYEFILESSLKGVLWSTLLLLQVTPFLKSYHNNY